MTKKYWFTLFIVCMAMSFSFQLNAQDKVMNILLSEGSKVVPLKTLSKITFSESDMVLNLSGGSTENVPIKNVSRFTFATSSGINNLNVFPKVGLYFDSETNQIMLENMPEKGACIEIYSITGNRVKTIQANQSTQVIDVSSLYKGIYILKLNNQVLKFTK